MLKPKRKRFSFAEESNEGDVCFSPETVQRRKSGESGLVASEASYLILVDYKKNYAICTALIVKELLIAECQGRAERIPQLVPHSSQVPVTAMFLMIICTTDCLRNPMFAKGIMYAAEIGVGVLPIIAETSFQFPMSVLYDEFRKNANEVLWTPSKRVRTPIFARPSFGTGLTSQGSV
ncbi:unnamed protein product [Prorocentrum cordatum]|uniref:Uncharacterized protein n=1 Tax=Prorocentrum cordatum TaxID=2364126 RepID=A0ABN9S674_9DINO|nr:unnamed protein product [Polarella glacialis]